MHHRLLATLSPKTFPTMLHVFTITDLCMATYSKTGRSSRIIIIIIIIIIITISISSSSSISFMQSIYTYIPETNYVPREYSVAAILLLLFMMLISLSPVFNLLYFYISTFQSIPDGVIGIFHSIILPIALWP